jgi:hypothetical protein
MDESMGRPDPIETTVKASQRSGNRCVVKVGKCTQSLDECNQTWVLLTQPPQPRNPTDVE